MPRWIACLLLCLPPLGWAAPFEDHFVVVLGGPASHARWGNPPWNRHVLAQAVGLAARARAKGVVLKFFLDQAREPLADQALARSLGTLPVVLQARLDDQELRPHPLPQRFAVETRGLNTSTQGRSGWLPLPAFAAQAHALCFADFNGSPVALVERYQEHTVKSLLLCPVELALGAQAHFDPGRRVQIGARAWPVDTSNRVDLDSTRSPGTLSVVEWTDWADGKVPDAALQGRVVILGYDGPNVPQLQTPWGWVGAHRAYALWLRAFWEGGQRE